MEYKNQSFFFASETVLLICVFNTGSAFWVWSMFSNKSQISCLSIIEYGDSLRSETEVRLCPMPLA